MRVPMFVLALCAIPLGLVAQPGVNTWQLHDRGQWIHEYYNDLFHRSAGGYYVCGSTNRTAWMLLLSEDGEPVWDLLYNGTDLRTVVEVDEGGAIAGGNLNGFGAVKIHPDGRIIWQQSYAQGACNAIIELKGGGYALAGVSNSHGYVTIIGADGNQVWGRGYLQNAGNCTIESMRETDGGLMLAGYAQGQLGAPPYEYGWIMKVDMRGDVIFSKLHHFNDQYNDYYWSMVSAPEGGFVTVGQSTGDPGGAACVLTLTHLSNDGDITWATRFDPGERNHFDRPSIAKTRHGGYVICGYNFRPNQRWERRQYILRVNGRGEEVWWVDFDENVQEEAAGPHHRDLTSIVTVGNDQFVAVGCSYEPDQGNGGQDGLFVKLDPNPFDPQVVARIPLDTLLIVLPDTRVDFELRVNAPPDMAPEFLWLRGADTIGTNSAVEVLFDTLGVERIVCQVSNPVALVETGWTVIVRDLFIRSHTPDTLSLTIHHGEIVPFGLSVAATPGDDPSYLWTLTDWAGGRFDTLGTDSMVSHRFDHGGTYLMEGIASRGTSADTVAWNIQVLSNVVAYHPDRTRLTYPQDTTVIFSVEPSEFDTGQYRYEWMVDGGWCSDSASAQVGFPFLGRSYVTVVVSDSAEADTIVWEVEVVEATATPPTPPSVEGGDYPHKFTLSVSPNPFNHRTAIRYSVPSRGEVRVSAYDVSGRLVKELWRGDRYPGDYSILWQAPAAGVYLIQVETEGGVRRVVKGVCLP